MKQTLFVKRSVINGEAIAAWAKQQGFETTLPPEDMHVTVAFSKTPLEWDNVEPRTDALQTNSADREVKPLGGEGAVVLRFESQDLQDRWQELCDAGAVWDYPTYQPHVTISYNAGDLDLSKVEPFRGAIILGPEIHQPVKLGWKADITEKAMTTQANGATPEQVLAYLKANAPDIAAIVEKTMDVGDVHKPTTGGQDTKKKPDADGDDDTAIKDGFPNLVAQAKNKMKKAASDDDTVEWRADIAITKVDPDKMMIFGWASIAQIDGVDVVDKQDDKIAVEDLEAGAYDFVLYSRQHGNMHMQKGTGRVIESCVFTQEKAEKGLIALDPETHQQIFGWWTGFKVDEPKVWDAHKRGELPEFSIGGRGTRVPA